MYEASITFITSLSIVRAGSTLKIDRNVSNVAKLMFKVWPIITSNKRSQNLILKWKLLDEFLNQNTQSILHNCHLCKRVNCNKTIFVTFILFLHQTIFFLQGWYLQIMKYFDALVCCALVLLFGKKDKTISTSASPWRDLTKSQLWTGILYSFYWEHCYVSLFLFFYRFLGPRGPHGIPLSVS